VQATTDETRLRAIKAAHTVIWAFFAGCILLIPALAWLGRYRFAAVLIALVLVEVLVIVLNGWRCPLTRVAARYTDDRRDNFDIWLPAWLARHNQLIFGAFYAFGILLTVILWGLRRT
jgi:hypothetical protein